LAGAAREMLGRETAEAGVDVGLGVGVRVDAGRGVGVRVGVRVGDGRGVGVRVGDGDVEVARILVGELVGTAVDACVCRVAVGGTRVALGEIAGIGEGRVETAALVTAGLPVAPATVADE
jgi:hypothetical protein